MGTVILKLKPSNEPNLPKHLAHAGIKGMRWGVRRYQNADGSLTELGKKRYASQVKSARTEAYNKASGLATRMGKSAADADAAGKKAANAASGTAKFDIGKEVQKDREATETIIKETGNAARTASSAVKNVKVDVPKMNLDGMTDQELRNQIARARLEGEYDSMFNPDRARAERGKARAAAALDAIGAVAGVTGSCLAIALMIKQLKGG